MGTIHVERVVRNSDSGKAVLVSIEEKSYWIPWSLIDTGSKIQKVGDSGTAYVQLWFLEKENIPHEPEKNNAT